MKQDVQIGISKYVKVVFVVSSYMGNPVHMQVGNSFGLLLVG